MLTSPRIALSPHPPARDSFGAVLALLLSLLFFATPASATLPGLTTVEAIPKYYNAKFPSTTATSANSPATLSLSTLFTDLNTLTPNTGLIPYGLNCLPWDDGAVTRRWIAIPNDGVPNTSPEKLTYNITADWSCPIGTVIVKHFDLPINDLQPTLTKKVETQVLVRDSAGTWYGVTYRWRDDQSDADLLSSTTTVNRSFSIPISATATRTQTWTYQPRDQCLTCHNTTAGALGLHTSQLNGLFTYEKTGRTSNQIWTLYSLGFLLGATLTETQIAALPKTAALNDFTRTVADRARSYLDANCAHCHRPGSSAFDLRYATALGSQKIINAPTTTDLGIPGQGILRPRSTATSMLHYRTNLVGTNQMPPLGKNRIDTVGVLTLGEWINSLQGYDLPGNPGVNAKYFNDTQFITLKTTRIDGTIDFDWGLGAPTPNNNINQFSVRWTTELLVPTTGAYTISVDADDGVRAWIDDGSIISDFVVHSPSRPPPRTATMTLNAGQLYTFELEYFDSVDTALCHVSWSGPGVSGIIPASAFFSSVAPSAPNPPIAANDTLTVARGASGSVNVVSNDTDPDNSVSASTVTIVTPPTRGIAVKNSSGTITYTSNATASGTSDMVVYTVKDATGNTSNRAALYVTIQPDYSNWTNLNFTTPEQANATISSWDADPDGDGESNLLEYATNTDPRSAASRSAPIQSIPSAGVLQLRFPKRPGADIIYSVETATDPTTWLSPDPSVTITENTTDHLTARIPMSARKKFVRLRCTLIP